MRDTPMSKILPHKIDEVLKDKTLPRDAITSKIHSQKSNEEIKVYNGYGSKFTKFMLPLPFQNYYYF